MINKLSIKKALTLVEILLAFFVIGIIAAIIIPATNSRVDNIANADLSYSTFYAINAAISESKVSDGTIFDNATNVCNAIVKYTNTTKYDCSNYTMTFLSGSYIKSMSYSEDMGTTIDVDIDGSRRNSTEASGDIIQILVTKNGVVLPIGENATKKEYLSGKFGIEDDDAKYIWSEANISYKDAMCKSGNLVGIDICSAYCGANYCEINESGIHEDCKTGLCEAHLIKPHNLK